MQCTVAVSKYNTKLLLPDLNIFLSGRKVLCRLLCRPEMGTNYFRTPLYVFFPVCYSELGGEPGYLLPISLACLFILPPRHTYLNLSLYLSIYTTIYLTIYQSTYLSLYLHIFPSLSIYLSIYLDCLSWLLCLVYSVRGSFSPNYQDGGAREYLHPTTHQEKWNNFVVLRPLQITLFVMIV